MSEAKVTFREGSIEAALANGAKLLEEAPAGAALQARHVLKTEPRNTAAHRLFAKAMLRLGNAEEARLARGRAIQFSRHVPALAQAHEARRQGREREVETILRDHLAKYPDDPVALTISGQALAQVGWFDEAIRRLQCALDFMPEYREAGVALVRVNHQRFDIPAALAALEPLIAALPGDVSLRRWKASLLHNLGEHPAAAKILRDLVQANPTMAELWISLGDTLRTMGQSADAHAAYRRAVEAAPALGAAWWSLAALRHAPFSEADQKAMEAALASSTDADNRHYLHFALATALEQAGARSEAFENFAAGNAVRFAQDSFDPRVAEQQVEASRRILTQEFFTRLSDAGEPAPDPIFIVSLPRSGSTLVEQVLASHPKVEGTAELPFIPALIRNMAAEHGLEPDRSYRELLPRLDPAIFASIGREYLRLARPHRKTNRPYFLDKLPHNWADIGFIKLILPNAKIIDVRRNPMDCCWSNFRMLFARGHPSSNSLEAMAAYYRQYVAMMAHFDEVLPGAVHRVIYERLVDDFEPEVRRMLDYIGLPFDPACLDFHSNSRSVATASADQVRRPLNRDGLGAWRAYEEWLGPLKDAVGDLEQTYDR